jgi:hypothetical protein
MIQKGLTASLAGSYQLPLDERMLLQQEFIAEKVKYLSQNTERRGNEIVAPPGVLLV